MAKTLIALLMAFAMIVAAPSSTDAAMTKEEQEAILTGKTRPQQVPAGWVGSSTKSAEGWRWDDPSNAKNSVRIFRGDPRSDDPRMRTPYVVVIRGGIVIGRDGRPLKGAVAGE